MNCCRTTGNQRTNQDGFAGGLRSMLTKADLKYSSAAFDLLSADPRSLRDLKRIIERLAYLGRDGVVGEIDCARVLADLKKS